MKKIITIFSFTLLSTLFSENNIYAFSCLEQAPKSAETGFVRGVLDPGAAEKILTDIKSQKLSKAQLRSDIGETFISALTNKEIIPTWKSKSKSYEFSVEKGTEVKWYCYFKEESKFFRIFLKPGSIVYDIDKNTEQSTISNNDKKLQEQAICHPNIPYQCSGGLLKDDNKIITGNYYEWQCDGLPKIKRCLLGRGTDLQRKISQYQKDFNIYPYNKTVHDRFPISYKTWINTGAETSKDPETNAWLKLGNMGQPDKKPSVTIYQQWLKDFPDFPAFDRAENIVPPSGYIKIKIKGGLSIIDGLLKDKTGKSGLLNAPAPTVLNEFNKLNIGF